MTNRLADLEQHLERRAASRKKPARQDKMRSALERMQPQRRPAPAPAPALPPAPASQEPRAQGLSGKVSRWPTRRTRAMSARALTAISYDVPGNFWVLRQPSGMACWATVFTMLKSWRSQREMTIPQALGAVGQHWVDIYNADTGLSSEDKPAFIAAAGLVAQPPQSFSLEGWENLLRNYGPIWVTTDERPGQPGGIHARIITGIHGDGSAENTQFRIVDPGTGSRYNESIAVFIPKFEDEARRASANDTLRIQVVHWQSDARSEQRALSLGRSQTGYRAPARALSAPPGVRSHGLNVDYTAALAANQRARAFSAIDVRYNVQLVPQQTGMSCWAAGFAMIVGWAEQMSIDPSEIARATGYWAQYQSGLSPEDVTVMNVWGFEPAPLQTLTVQGFADLLRSRGPLWVASAEPGPHIRVATGMQGDGTPDGTLVHINDPWEQGMTSFRPSNRGSQYTETYRQFVEKQSRLARQEMRIDAPVYVAYLRNPPAWMHSAVAQSFSHFIGRPIAMEAPSNPDNYRLLSSGAWNSNTTLAIRGGQGMWFKIRNTNVLGTTIRIREQSGQVKQSIILPASTVEFVFTVFGSEPMGWRFDISTDSDAFVVTWELWSTWVPGMPPNG